MILSGFLEIYDEGEGGHYIILRLVGAFVLSVSVLLLSMSHREEICYDSPLRACNGAP